MDQKRLLSAVVALFIAMGPSVALAIDPLGPPKAGPEAGQFQISADLLYGAVDLDFHRKSHSQTYQNGVAVPNESASGSSFEMQSQATNKLYANFGYGILRNWEAFLRLGGADTGIGGGIRFAIGGGTKVTFYEAGNWSFGGILQLSWTGWKDESDYSQPSSPDSYTASGRTSLTEVQSALGASYQLNSHVSLYGGPFVAFVRGTSDSKGTQRSADAQGTYMVVSRSSDDIDEDSWFGGYLGARIQIHKNAVAAIEYQHTGGADAFAVSVLYRFGQPR